MKVLPPFIGFPSPNVTLGVWHLFARVGGMFQHVAFMVLTRNRWGDHIGSYPVRGEQMRYPEEDLQRWSEFRP